MSFLNKIFGKKQVLGKNFIEKVKSLDSKDVYKLEYKEPYLIVYYIVTEQR